MGGAEILWKGVVPEKVVVEIGVSPSGRYLAELELEDALACVPWTAHSKTFQIGPNTKTIYRGPVLLFAPHARTHTHLVTS